MRSGKRLLAAWFVTVLLACGASEPEDCWQLFAFRCSGPILEQCDGATWRPVELCPFRCSEDRLECGWTACCTPPH